VRGWQRCPYRGYSYSGSRFNGGIGQGSGDQRTSQNSSHVHDARFPVHNQVGTGVETSRRGVMNA
jgi:hypothetical protein